MEKGLHGVVLERFARLGLRIAACRMARLDSALLREHYAHVADKPFFPEIEQFMSSQPVIILVLEAPGVIDRVRNLLGPTDSTQAPAGTIRGDYGADKMRNICHASDSPESAAAEVKRFFKPQEIY